MKQDVAEAWVKDLRSGIAVQAKEALYNGIGYCCLGRLAVVLGKKFVLQKCPMTDKYRYYIEGTNSYGVLDLSTISEAGMRTLTGIMKIPTGPGEFQIVELELSSENDSGLTFPQIADLIEYAPELL